MRRSWRWHGNAHLEQDDAAALPDSISGYDSTYVALAEMAGASALLTTDERLASAPGVQCVVEVV